MDTKDTRRRIEEFLEELTELTKKHQIEIGGCGCDGSPWLDDLSGESLMTNLTWSKEGSSYDPTPEPALIPYVPPWTDTYEHPELLP